jgi:hypothetical protein
LTTEALSQHHSRAHGQKPAGQPPPRPPSDRGR